MTGAEKCRWFVGRAIILATLACPTASAAPIRAQNAADKTIVSDRTLAAIIDDVRVNEAKYRDLEIVIKTSGWRRSTPYGIGWTSESISTSVYDGDRFYFHLKKETLPYGLRPARTEVLAAFDGQTTRSVEYANSANIYLGRREPGEMVPPHSWVLACCGVHFALSTFLSGTEGLRNDPKTPDYGKAFANSLHEVACEVDGEEVLDGLRCYRIRCQEDRGAFGRRFTYLWIAPERNDLCVRLKQTFGNNLAAQEHPWLESSVRAWKRISGDRWLPARIETQWSDQDRKSKAWAVVAGESQDLENVVVGPKHQDRFFRDIEFSKDVPVFTIKDGQPVDDVLKTVEHVTKPDEALQRVIDALRQEEQRFSHFEVRAHAAWFDLDDAPSWHALWTQNDQFHFVVGDGRRYYENSWMGEGAGGGHTRGVGISAYDGKWTRSLTTFRRAAAPSDAVEAHRARGKQPAAPNFTETKTRASISLGADDFHVIRPHMLFFDNNLRVHHGGTLSDYLSTGIWYRGSGDFPTRRETVTYLGEDRRSGLECHVIQFRDDPPSGSSEFIVWLAKDRNLIPVRYEQRNPAKNLSLPLAFGQVDEMREIDKGVWFPTKVSEWASVDVKWTRNRVGRVQFDWRRDFVVDEVNRNPIFSKEADAKLTIPKGTEVTVDIPGKGTVTLRQEKTGLAAVSPDAWRGAIFEQIVRRSNASGRRFPSGEQRDALFGTTLPALPKGTWINTRPLTWDDLYGRVVVLHFFVEQVGYCEPDLKWLAQDLERLTKKGIVVLGVHPPGAIEPVTNLASKLGLKYPICIDASPPDWSASWGRLGDACDIRIVPVAVVVGRDGKIYGRGTLGHALLLSEKALQDRGRRRNPRSAINPLESH